MFKASHVQSFTQGRGLGQIPAAVEGGRFQLLEKLEIPGDSQDEDGTTWPALHLVSASSSPYGRQGTTHQPLNESGDGRPLRG